MHLPQPPRRRSALHMLLLIAAGLAACGPPAGEATKAPPPAVVAKPMKEADLATITLTPETEARLGLTVAKVERRAIERTRLFGGEVVPVPGNAVVVSAPMSGTLVAAAASAPAPGGSIAKGQALYAIVLTPQESVRFAGDRASVASAQIEAVAAVERAKVQVDASQVSLARAEKLVEDSIGSAESLEDARTRTKLSETTLRAAEAQRDSLAKALGPGATSGAPLRIPSPMAGVLLRVHALPGQVVAAGAPLFEVASQDPVWIKLPIYAGDLGTIAADRSASVDRLGGSSKTPPRPARPVSAPPSADARAATIDLYYAVDNADGALRLGERVSVVVPIAGEAESLVVPWAAVLVDYHGGSWVYERTAPGTYVRARVLVHHVAGDVAALSLGPKAGAEVVTAGAAELFGTELGAGK